ncbi:adenosine 5'-monophosphoramidase HINT3-like [Athalia rosae]|uniref:adenosine 5'-monophosphoramidase HINT3-like n=1 Tax=Athalia rosae TaxID=37344 RepID=UPI00203365CD|nr:adenosine 5'-monophosphoramidase HINT3-like [Athalia rosae]
MSSNTGDCIFCKIIAGQAPCEMIYQDDVVICIKDIKPASTYHYLIIPKRHIDNAKVLHGPEDKDIFEHMVKVLSKISEEKGIVSSEARTGFHWPPFTSINHLHLHLISPVENMSFISRLIFRPNSLWFVSVDYVRSRFDNSS